MKNLNKDQLQAVIEDKFNKLSTISFNDKKIKAMPTHSDVPIIKEAIIDTMTNTLIINFENYNKNNTKEFHDLICISNNNNKISGIEISKANNLNNNKIKSSLLNELNDIKTSIDLSNSKDYLTNDINKRILDFFKEIIKETYHKYS